MIDRQSTKIGVKTFLWDAGKALLLWLLVSAMVWVATLWRWHITQADPNGYDLFLYLVATPTLITASMLFLLWQAKKLRAAIQDMNEPPTNPSVAPPTQDKG